MSYRSDFIKGFGDLFTTSGAREHYEWNGIESMELDEENEIVTIHFTGGGIHKVNVAGDSLSAMAYDVVRHGL